MRIIQKKKIYKKTFYVYLWYHQQILSGNHMLFGQIPEFHDCYPHILAPQEKRRKEKKKKTQNFSEGNRESQNKS